MEIRNKYSNAKDKYMSFCETDKMIFDLYAGQEVRNCVEICRRNLVNSMRHDIGIN